MDFVEAPVWSGVTCTSTYQTLLSAHFLLHSEQPKVCGALNQQKYKGKKNPQRFWYIFTHQAAAAKSFPFSHLPKMHRL